MSSPALYPKFRAYDPSTGLPLVGGKLFTDIAGTSTPQATYTDAALTVPNANPIILDANGEAVIYTGPLAYKFILQKSDGTAIWTFDNYAPNLTALNLAEWVPYTGAFVFVNATTFSLTGLDVTGTFTVGRRVKSTNTAGTVYGTITASVFSAGNTAVTLLCDGASALDAGFTAPAYGVNSYSNPSYLDPLSVVAQKLTAAITGFAALTQVTGWTTEINTLGEFAANAFTAKYPGYYRVSLQACVQDTTAASEPIFLVLNKNGAAFAGTFSSTGGVANGSATLSINKPVLLAAGDVLKMYLQGTANTTVVQTQLGGVSTHLCVERIR